MALHLKKPEFPSSKIVLCQVLLNLAQWFWRGSREYLKFTDDGQTYRGQKVIRIDHLSFHVVIKTTAYLSAEICRCVVVPNWLLFCWVSLCPSEYLNLTTPKIRQISELNYLELKKNNIGALIIIYRCNTTDFKCFICSKGISLNK